MAVFWVVVVVLVGDCCCGVSKCGCCVVVVVAGCRGAGGCDAEHQCWWHLQASNKKVKNGTTVRGLLAPL